MTDYILKNAMAGENVYDIVALGYVQYRKVRDRADEVMKHIGRKNFMIHHAGMMVVRIPKTKLKKVLDTFPNIKETEKYWKCNYSWQEEEDKSFELPSNIHKFEE